MTALLRMLLLSVVALMATASTGTRRGGRRRGHRPKSQYKPNTLEHFAEFCRRFIVLDNGKPFELEPFQRLILAGFFAGVTELLVLLPKKNGKTTLLAALAIYHLIYTPNAACYIAASAVDQARILYEQACGFVERKDASGKLLPQAAQLQKRIQLRKGTKEIRSRRDSGFIRVVSGDKDTVDGVIVTLGLVDELHRHRDGELYGVLADGIGPRDGQVITISTAGESMKTALGRIRQRAYKLPGIRRDGAYVHVRSPNGEFEMHEWSLRDEDSRDDMRIVKAANPLSTNTTGKLAQRYKSPTMTPSRWARFGCGVWMQGEDSAYSSIDLKRATKSNLTIEPGGEVYIGLDIGWRWDTTAAVPGEPYDREELIVCPDCEAILPDTETLCRKCERLGQTGWWRFRRVRYAPPKILVPPRNGESLAREKVIGAVLHFRDDLDLDILGVVFDRNAEGELVAQELEAEHGIPVIQHSQDPSPMADASMGFAEALGDGLVEIPDDDEFLAAWRACKAKTTKGERWRIVPPNENRGQRKRGQQDGDDIEVIDAAIGGVMLHHVATALQAPPEAPPDDLLNYRIGFV